MREWLCMQFHQQAHFCIDLRQLSMASGLPEVLCILLHVWTSFLYWYRTSHAEWALMLALLDVQAIFQMPGPVARFLMWIPELRHPTRLPCWPAVLQQMRLPLQTSSRQLQQATPQQHPPFRCDACRWET